MKILIISEDEFILKSMSEIIREQTRYDKKVCSSTYE